MKRILKEYLQKIGFGRFDLKAVLFDMDGVLYDSMKYHSQSWYETMNEYGIDSTPEEFYLYEGMVGSETIDLLIQRNFGREATEKEKTDIYQRKTELFNKYNNRGKMPFVDTVLKKVKNDGLQPVVVTGSGQKSLIDKLEEEFPDTFHREMIITAFDVKKGKPDPEPYLMGLKKAGGLSANQAIVVENAPLGVKAAAAAGIFTIAVNTGPLDDHTLWDAGANMVLPSMQTLAENWDEYYKEISAITV